MMSLYDTIRWRKTRQRALRRDGRRCTVSRLLGGVCSRGPLHVHHVVPVRDGGDLFDLDNLATACAAHHALWEPLRRLLVERIVRGEAVEHPAACRHRHRSAEARRLCEARLARRRGLELAA